MRRGGIAGIVSLAVSCAPSGTTRSESIGTTSAAVTVGSENALSSPEYSVPSVVSQHHVVWTGSSWTLGFLHGYGKSYGLTTVGLTGAAAAPARVLVPYDEIDQRWYALDTDGSQSLLLRAIGAALEIHRFDSAGAALGAPSLVNDLPPPDDWVTDMALAHGGGQTLAVWNKVLGADQSLMALRLSATGAPLGAPVEIATKVGGPLTALYDGTDFVIGWPGVSTDLGCFARTMSTSGVLSARKTLVSTMFGPRQMNISWSPTLGRHFVHCDGSGQVVDKSLAAVGAKMTFGSPGVPAAFRTGAAGPSGFGAMTLGYVGLFGQRVDADGNVLDATPKTVTTFTNTVPRTFDSSSSSSQSLLHWIWQTDYAVHGVRVDLASMATTDTVPLVLTKEAVGPTAVSVTADEAGNTLASWVERRMWASPLGSDGAAKGAPSDLGPAVGRHVSTSVSGTHYLVWNKGTALVSSRVNSAGAVIDGTPKTLLVGSTQPRALACDGARCTMFADGAYLRFLADGTLVDTALQPLGFTLLGAARASGRVLLVHAGASGGLAARRFQLTTGLEDTTPIDLGAPDGKSPTVVGTSDGFEVYYVAGGKGGAIRRVRVAQTGAILDPKPIEIAPPSASAERILGAANDGSTTLVGWLERLGESQFRGFGLQVLADGTVAQPTPAALITRSIFGVAASFEPSIELAAMGSGRFATAWIGRDGMQNAQVFSRAVSFASRLGLSCTAGAACESGVCADGVCCDRACGGQCEACDVTGKVGKCTAVVGAPHAPRDACPGTAGTCGFSCDGTQRAYCVATAKGTSCGAATCSLDVETHTSTCDGAGRCDDVPKSCGAYTCGATACRTSCAADTECSPGFFCKSGACTPIETLGKACTGKSGCGAAFCVEGVCCAEDGCGAGRSCALAGSKGRCAKVDGQSCAAASECGSGFCADGVCCESACDTQCAACDVTGSVGKCVAVSGRPHGKRTACEVDAGSPCASRRCDGSDLARCAGYVGKDVRCRSAECTAAGAVESAQCDGAGGCPAAVPVSCGAFTCDETTASCRATCAGDTQCAAGYVCKGGACVGAEARCSEDGLKVVAANGVATSCSPARCADAKCVDVCVTSEQCAPAFVCGEGKCITPSAGDDSGGGCSVGRPVKGPTHAWLLVLGAALGLRLRRRLFAAVSASAVASCGHGAEPPTRGAPATVTRALPRIGAAQALPLLGFSRAGDGWSARRAGADLRLTAHGLQVESIAFTFASLGEVGSTAPTPDLSQDGSLRTVRGSGVLERWDLVERGVEQSFLVPARPKGPLVLRTRVEGARSVRVVGDAAILTGAGREVRYDGAVFVDATGKRTPLRPTWNGAELSLTVPTDVVDHAAFPAVLDPVIGLATAVDTTVDVVTTKPILHAATKLGTRAWVAFTDGEVLGAMLGDAGVMLYSPARSFGFGATGLDVGWDGTSTGLVVWADPFQVSARRVGLDGSPTGSTIAVIPSPAYPSPLAVAYTNGVFGIADRGVRYVALKPDGTLSTTAPVNVESFFSVGAPAIAPNGTMFDLAYSTGLTIRCAQVTATTGTTVGAPATCLAAGVGAPSRSDLRLVRNGTTALLTFRDGGVPKALRLGATMAAIGTPIALSTVKGTGTLGAFAEGTGFHVTWTTPTSTAGVAELRATNVDAAGLVATPDGQLVTTVTDATAVTSVRLASEVAAIAGKSIVRYSPSTGTTIAPTPTTFANRSETHLPLGVYFDGKEYAVTYADQVTSTGNIALARFAPSGAALGVTDTGHAMSPNKRFIATSGGDTTLFGEQAFATRFKAGSTLGTTKLTFADRITSAGWNGTSFVVSDYYTVLRLGPDGVPLGTYLTPPGVWTNSVVSRVLSGDGKVLALLASAATSQAVRMRADGTFEDAAPLLLGPLNRTTGAWAKDRWLVTSENRVDATLLANLVGSDGTVSKTLTLDATKRSQDLAVASDGDRFLLVARETSSTTAPALKGLVVERDGLVATPSWFSIEDGVSTQAIAFGVASAGPGKFLVGYAKADPGSGASRALVRTISFAGGLGDACTADSGCESGFCVDGVCCNLRCSDTCGACDVKGSEGRCLAVIGAPHGTRSCPAPTGSCGNRCDGVDRAACHPQPPSTPCSSTGCSAGVETHASACNGAGGCLDEAKSCGVYACGASACKTSCTVRSDCAAGNYCKGGACVATEGLGRVCTTKDECADVASCVDGVCCEASSCGAGETCSGRAKAGICTKTVGQACAKNDECGSGFCVDGVCCGSACDSQCQACDVPGSLGTCVAITGKPHGARTACPSDAANPCKNALCDGSDTTRCAGLVASEVVCRATACEGGSLVKEARCDGFGACPTETKASCGGFACSDASSCRTACATDSECADGFMCEANSCVPRADRCTTDGTAVQKTDGTNALCAPAKCRAGKCIDICLSSADCADGFLCDPTGKCVSTAQAATEEDSGCTFGGGARRGGALFEALALLMLLRRRR